MTRDILNHLGETIGSLTLPDETTEEQWTAALAMYSYVPPAPTLTQIITAKVQTAAEFGATIVLNAKVGNVALGVTQAGKTKEVSDFLSELARYLNEGSLYAAVAEINRILSTDIPSELSPFITVDRLTVTKNLIQDFLGIPRT